CAAVGAANVCPSPAPDRQLWENQEYAYCLQYPAGYKVEQPGEGVTVIMTDSLLSVQQPRANIEVENANGRSASSAATQLAAEFEASVPGIKIARTNITLGGEQAVVLDNLPGQDLNRRVLVVHDNRLYTLMFSPTDQSLGDAYSKLEELYQAVTESFRFI
ncbi:MAG: hypothetical protein ACM3JD_02010, partial [Rudaea sp.]